MVTPLGVGVHSTWERLISNSSGITWYEDAAIRRLAIGAIPEFNPNDHLDQRLIHRTSRFSQLGLVAAIEALADAKLDLSATFSLHPQLQQRTMVSIGTSFGGVTGLVTEVLEHNKGARISPRLVTRAIPSALASQLAIEYSVVGPAFTISGACAASAQAIGEAHLRITSGEYDIAIAGGSDSLFIPEIVESLVGAGAISSSGGDDPKTWSRPFDSNRTGMVLGEGSAILVLENPQQAQLRGASIYGYLVGYGVGNDAFHETAPHPDGAGAARAMADALSHSHLSPHDIKYVNAHATGTKVGDAAESLALRRVFRSSLSDTPVSSIKGAVAHTLGAAGAIEAAISLLAIKHSALPPTLNSENPDELAPPDIVPNESRAWEPGPVMSNSFGFGGQNASLVFVPKAFMD